MGTPFKTVQTQDATINQIQSNISSALNSVSGPFIGGNLLSSQTIGTTPTTINHGLNRQPVLWVISDQDTLTDVKRISWNSNSIVLQAGSACTISIWVN